MEGFVLKVLFGLGFEGYEVRKEYNLEGGK